jgi:hypothetical protein
MGSEALPPVRLKEILEGIIVADEEPDPSDVLRGKAPGGGMAVTLLDTLAFVSEPSRSLAPPLSTSITPCDKLPFVPSNPCAVLHE